MFLLISNKAVRIMESDTGGEKWTTRAETRIIINNTHKIYAAPKKNADLDIYLLLANKSGSIRIIIKITNKAFLLSY